MKKLFKLSLVLCASILMAVSCSNNNTNPNDTNKTPAPETPAPEKKSKATLDEIKAVVKALADVKVKVTKAQPVQNAVKFDFSTLKDQLTGADGIFTISADKAIVGSKESDYTCEANDKIVYADLVTAFDGKLKTALGSKIELVKDNPIVVASIGEEGKKVNVTISFQDKDADKGKGIITIALGLDGTDLKNLVFAPKAE